MTKPPKKRRAWNSTLSVGKGLSRVSIPRKARTPIKHKPRPKDQTERIYGPQEFRDWLHAQPCAVCGAASVYTQQAHAKTGGKGRKDDWTRTLPLCGPRPTWGPLDEYGLRPLELAPGCHADSAKRQTFEKKHGVTLLGLAAETQNRWQAYSHSRKSA